MKFIIKDQMHILKDGNKIKGFVIAMNEIVYYSFNKPSDNNWATFSKSQGSYTINEAKEKLLNGITETDNLINEIIKKQNHVNRRN